MAYMGRGDGYPLCLIHAPQCTLEQGIAITGRSHSLVPVQMTDRLTEYLTGTTIIAATVNSINSTYSTYTIYEPTPRCVLLACTTLLVSVINHLRVTGGTL